MNGINDDAHMADLNEATLSLAAKESAEHLEGMGEAYSVISKLPLQINAYTMDDSNAPRTAKTVHFVRHGQGFHNLLADIATESGVQWKQFTKTAENPYVRPEILDAPLTEKGRQQALQLQATVQSLPHLPELVVCSPNCRALQTAMIAFEALTTDRDVSFLALESLREETGIHICDKRRPTSRQQAEFPRIDFSMLKEDDPIFREDTRDTKLQVAQRVYWFMDWLADQPEDHIAVVGHSAWLLTLFNAVARDDCHPNLQQWFQTGEMRSTKLVFTRPPVDEEA